MPSLRRLLASDRHEVVAVLTRPDTVAGRGRKTVRSPIARLADEHGVEVLAPTRASDPDLLARLTELAPDCCPVVAYGNLLRAPLLEVPKYGWINLHFSLLPAWRGAAPVQAAIAAGDEVTGASTFLIEEGLDTGPVFGVVTERVTPTDTAQTLLDRLADTGAVLLERTLDGIEDGAIVPQPQSHDGVSHAPKVTVESARIVWTLPPAIVERRIRSVTPAPGAWTTIGETRLKVGPVQLTDVTLPAGRVAVSKREVLIGTAGTAVRLDRLQPQGKKEMIAADWARGAHLPDDAEAR